MLIHPKDKIMKLKYYSFLSVISISFWFFLGFPFAKYHESYEWIAQLNTHSTLDFIFQNIGHYDSCRPIGQVTAIVLFKLFNNSLMPIQLFNYILIALSFIILVWEITEKRGLIVILTIVGAIYFKAFTYLFHLHGLYYSPLLLLISILIFNSNKPTTNKRLIILSFFTFITALYHPFAIFISIFFLIGYIIEKRETISIKYYFLSLIFIVVAIGLLLMLVPDQFNYFALFDIKHFLDAYRVLDINPILSLVSAIFSQLIIRSISNNFKVKNLLSLIIFFLSILFYYTSIPVFIVWVLSSILKMLLLRKWAILSLIIITFIFPLVTGFESNHLAFLILIVCAYTLPYDYYWFESKLKLFDYRFAIIFLLCVMSLFIILKKDMHLPFISKYVNLLLAEKEKTYQLEKIISWSLNSKYKEYDILFISEYFRHLKKYNKLKSENNPVSNDGINAYLNSIRRQNSSSQIQNVLFVGFNNQVLENSELIFSVNSKYAGRASVFLSSE